MIMGGICLSVRQIKCNNKDSGGGDFMLTGEMLAKWCEAALEAGAKYWYGTCWYAATEDLLARKAKQYPSHYGEGRLKTYRRHIADGRMVCDCVGLIKGFFWTGNGTAANKYRSNNCPDTSANGLIKLCERTGDIADMPEQRGLILWKSGHVGVYVGDGRVIEARGFSYGVVRTQLTARGWKKWGYLPEIMISYGDGTPGAAPEAAPAVTPLLKYGMEGEAVERLQTILTQWNPKALPVYGVDGEFGSETRAWVRKFQKAMGVDVDGIVGPETWGMLLEV